VKLCDITQFFSPTSGGVKRYLLSKAAYIQTQAGISHVLIVPGPGTIRRWRAP
jgi:alpha-1,6-mannosyltransferase